MEKSFTYSEYEVKEIIRKTVDQTSPLFHDNLKLKMADEIFEKVKKKEEKVYYRVCNQHTLRGLWYHFNGEFSGIIHNEFKFCKHKDLEMDFDPELVGWLSATDTLNGLFEWFPPEDIFALQDEGWYIHKFVTTDAKFYDKFQHIVINQETSKSIGRIVLREVKDGDQEFILIHD